MGYRPWGKIIAILMISAGIMGVFVWKYLQTIDVAGSRDDLTVQVPAVVQPLYNIFGEKLFLVIGAVAAILFAAVSLKAVVGTKGQDPPYDI
ncbi:MAG: hypothetical protein GY854_24550 [Deltaproteobacteria bacterium]|nr:hypothetical protein [Deltaproteobacteria bacterium]